MVAQDWARFSGEYRLSTGRRLADLPVDELYEIGMALIARMAQQDPQVVEALYAVALHAAFDSPEPVVQHQVRRADGFLEHDPAMAIPGWGQTDIDSMPDFVRGYGPTE